MRLRQLMVITVTIAASFFCSFFCPLGLNAQGSDLSHIRAIFAELRNASGGAAWGAAGEIITESEINVGGTLGRVTSFEDLRHGANTFHLEFPSVNVRQANGTTESYNWDQDANGDISVSDDPGSARHADDDLYLTRRDYFKDDFGGAAAKLLSPEKHQDILCDRVQIEPRSGYPLVFWVSQAAHLLVRLDRMTDPPSTKVFSDYRRVSGLMLPFSISREEGGHAGPTMTVKTTTILAELRPRDVAVPFRDDYSLGGSRSVTVPFEGEKAPLLRAMINGKGPFKIMFDTGSINIVSADFAKQNGLTANGNVSVPAFSGSVIGQTTKIDSLQIGGLTMRTQDFTVIQFPKDFVSATDPLAAVIGYQTLRRMVVRADYDSHQLTFFDAPSFKYSGAGAVLPIHLRQTSIVFDGTIDGVRGSFDVDTGQEESLSLYTKFVADHDLVAHYNSKFRGIVGYGYGGETHGYLSRVKELKLGEYTVHDVVTELDLGTEGVEAQSDAGNVGMGILRQFNITFDCMHGRMYLEKNHNYGKFDAFNRAGMVLKQTSDGAQVVMVLAGGPASDAAIAEGDIVTLVDGHPTSNPDFLQQDEPFLQPLGTTVHLKVRRGDSSRDVSLKLRDVL